MNMTPKKILSIPVYSVSGIFGFLALLLLVPGGIAILLGLAGCWVGDKLTSDKYDHIDTTIEEYEEHIDNAEVYK
jgi:hypothetical protein